MTKKLLKIFILIAVASAFSCAKKTINDPIILPPNFAEVPDTNKPEQPAAGSNEENVAKLKELLLKSDE